MDYFFDESKFVDPADWNVASYNAHPVDVLEPIAVDVSSYREAALQCLRILAAVDSFVSGERDPRLASVVVASVIGLDSTHGLSQSEISKQLGVSELLVRRATARFTKLADLDSFGGLRPLGQIRTNRSALKESILGSVRLEERRKPYRAKTYSPSS